MKFFNQNNLATSRSILDTLSKTTLEKNCISETVFIQKSVPKNLQETLVAKNKNRRSNE
jgi:hypothetical protein